MEIKIEEMIETTVNAEVRHCGFCMGNVPRVKYSIGHYQMFCRSCAARGPIQETWELAIVLWNRVMHQISESHASENMKKRMNI